MTTLFSAATNRRKTPQSFRFSLPAFFPREVSWLGSRVLSVAGRSLVIGGGGIAMSIVHLCVRGNRVFPGIFGPLGRRSVRH